MHQTADCIIKLMARKAICKDMQTSSAVVNMGCSLFPFKLCDAMPAVVLKFVSTVCILRPGTAFMQGLSSRWLDAATAELLETF